MSTNTAPMAGISGVSTHLASEIIRKINEVNAHASILRDARTTRDALRDKLVGHVQGRKPRFASFQSPGAMRIDLERADAGLTQAIGQVENNMAGLRKWITECCKTPAARLASTDLEASASAALVEAAQARVALNEDVALLAWHSRRTLALGNLSALKQRERDLLADLETVRTTAERTEREIETIEADRAKALPEESGPPAAA